MKLLHTQSTERCLQCRQCSIAKPGARKKAPHPCAPVVLIGRSRGRPSKPFRFVSLFGLLKAITPRRVWRSFRRRRGWSEETHGHRFAYRRHLRPRVKAAPVDTPWRALRREHKGEEWLISTSPRVATAAVHGPNVLARPYFPDVFEAPQTTLTEDEAIMLTIEQQARRLARRDHMCVGGRSRTLEQLSELPDSIYTTDIEDTEPLRAMALKSVTNLDDLEALASLKASVEPPELDDLEALSALLDDDL